MFAIGALIFIFAFSEMVFAEDFQVGYINIASVFKDYKKVEDSNKSLEESKEQVKKMVSVLRGLQENYEQLSDEAKAKKKKEITSKQEEIQKRTLVIRKDEDRVLRELLQDIENVGKTLRKNKKLTYILDDRIVIAGPKEMDLTKELVGLLNERYKGK